jgi:DNA mismatch repair protein MutS
MPPGAKDPFDTPAMRQFTRFKAEHPGCVLFFRMGDFYEMFGEDAVEMSRVLGLTLSERPKGVPLAGVPHHQLHNYLKKAIDRGYRVAVCDQIQDPRDAKGVVERAVTRVVTAGTLVEESLLGEDSAAVAAAVPVPGGGGGGGGGGWSGAAVELSTGRFTLFDCPPDGLGEPIARLGVREMLIPEGDPDGVREATGEPRPAFTERPPWPFRPDEARRVLLEQFRVATFGGFGLADDDPALPAAGALVAYLLETQSVREQPEAGGRWAASGGEFQGQKRTLAHLRPPAREDDVRYCRLDAVSLRALEVVRTIRGDTGQNADEGSLLGVFTGTRGLLATAMGRRLIREWLCRPLAGAEAVLERQRAVATLVEDRRSASALERALEGMPDVARIAGRVALGRATPRDLVALASALERLGAMRDAIRGAPAFGGIDAALGGLGPETGPIVSSIRALCVEEAPASLRQGGLIRDGVDAELDEARLLQRDAGRWLAEYQSRLIARHDLPSLKVGFNKVFGYFIELPAAQARRAPDGFTRTQTLKNAERYTTPELKDFERKVTTAEDRALDRERALFAGLLEQAAARVGAIGRFADAAATMDVFAALAGKAHRRGWTRPEIVPEPVLVIEGGRHPVLDELLGERFVPNDVALGGASEPDGARPRLALITGPNMAGKSTYIRQNALLTLLASIGSFIPADRATIGVCDRIFTRVGADDALHRGQSTFMVEMTETAAILNGATPRSLVILDEIGRGTSTLDGLSLAWAIAERLGGDEAPGPRTLFATHYHELTGLEDILPGRVRNLHVQVREWPDAHGHTEIIFVHRIAPGRADRSYGVHVARLAGVPRAVTERAEEILATLSVQDGRRADTPRVEPARRRGDGQLGLFTEFLPHPAVDRLREIKIETLSPMQAFEVLRQLATDARER